MGTKKLTEVELLNHRAHLEEVVAQRTTELKTMLDAVGAAVLRHDVATDRVVLDEAWSEISGICQEAFAQTLESWTASLHQDDRERIAREVDRVFATDAIEMETEYRLTRPDGETRYIEFRAIILQHHERLDGSGYPSGLRGE